LVIWSGAGLLTIVLLGIGIALGVFVGGAIPRWIFGTNGNAAVLAESIGMLIGAIVGVLPNLATGLKLNERGNVHTLFFFPMQYWSLFGVLVIVGMAFTGNGFEWPGAGQATVLRGSAAVGAAAFVADGREVLSSERSVLRYWDVTNGRELRSTALSSSIDKMAPLSDGRQILATRWKILLLIDAAGGQDIRTFGAAAARSTISRSPATAATPCRPTR
jgi:hypothetical protein